MDIDSRQKIYNGYQGRNEGESRVAKFPGRRITIGAPNDCEVRR